MISGHQDAGCREGMADLKATHQNAALVDEGVGGCEQRGWLGEVNWCLMRQDVSSAWNTTWNSPPDRSSFLHNAEAATT